MNDITQSLVAHGALVVFVVVFVDQAGVPIPSAAWLLAAGALSASGKMSVSVAVGMSVAACLLADSLWFYVGRRGGDRVLSFLRRWSWAPGSAGDRTKGLVDRHGLRGLVIAKFLPGLGVVMPPLAGALGVNAFDFLLFDSLGALLYGGFYTVAGFLLHDQLRQALAALRELSLGALLFALVLVATCIAFNWVRRRPCFLGCARDSGAQVPGAHPSMSEWSI
jgi:membrane protein DedA with SNARE-associated domain